MLKNINIQYPAGNFTFKTLASLNQNVNAQTLRLRLYQTITDGKITKTDELIKAGKRGRSEYVYAVNS